MILNKLVNYWKAKPLICRSIIAIILWVVAILFFLKVGITEYAVNINDFYDSTVTIDEQGPSVTRSWMVQAHHLHGVRYYYQDREGMALNPQQYYLTVKDNDRIIFEGSASSVDSGEIVFDVPGQNITMGNRYNFEISLINAPGLSCDLMINSAYAGLGIEGTEQDIPVHIDVLDYKLSNLGWLALIIVSFYSFAIVFSIWLKKSFGQTIALSVTFVIAVMFIFGIFGHLLAGVYVVVILAALTSIWISLLLIMGKVGAKDIFSLGFVVFSVIIMILLIYDRNSATFRARYDEYSLWGKAVKDMFCFDSLAVHEGSAVLGAYRYVPAMQLIEYLSVRLYGMFADGKLFFAYHLVFAAFGIATVDRCNQDNERKSKFGYIVGLLIVILLSSLFVEYALSTIYVDAILGILGMFTVVLGYYAKEKADWILFASGMMMLCLTKEMGLVIALLILLVVGICRIIGSYDSGHCIKKSGVVNALFGMIFGTLWFGAYYIYCSISNSQLELLKKATVQSVGEASEVVIKAENVSSFSHAYNKLNVFEKFKAILIGNGQAYQYQVLKNYIKEILNGDTAGGYALLLVVVFIIGLAFLAYHFKIGTDIRCYSVASGISILGYSLVLMILYMTVFPDSHAVGLHSFGRYMGSILITFYVPAIFIWMNNYLNLKKNDILLVILIGVVLISPVSEILFGASTDEIYINGLHNQYKNTSSGIFSVLERNDKIVYIDTGYSDVGYQEFTDAVIPINPVGRIAQYEDYSRQEFLEYLRREDISYAYVTWISGKYEREYRDLFYNGVIMKNTLYKVTDNEDGRNVLTPILNMGDNLTYGWYF